MAQLGLGRTQNQFIYSKPRHLTLGDEMKVMRISLTPVADITVKIVLENIHYQYQIMVGCSMRTIYVAEYRHAYVFYIGVKPQYIYLKQDNMIRFYIFIYGEPQHMVSSNCMYGDGIHRILATGRNVVRGLEINVLQGFDQFDKARVYDFWYRQ